MGRKEGAVNKAGKGTLNAVDSECEAQRDSLETTKHKEQCHVAAEKVTIPIIQGSFGNYNCQSHTYSHTAGPSPSGPHTVGLFWSTPSPTKN